ncbi:MAG: endonuclease/exonuclease/phosphatase family protein [Prevotellaceae bacterium]|nr:endonuclease/exonuclease/phosphatase family protein [Prevotellaceae bacterium]
MKHILLILIMSGFYLTINAQDKKYTILFYNVENLFDTINSPDVRDEEFTPSGAKKWDGKKYWQKLSKLEEVFYAVSSSVKSYPTIIGVSEIENRNVLEDIAALQKLQKANYQIAHFDSPDARGVDVALFYRPDQFKYEGSIPIRVDVGFRTRDILMVWGTIENEKFCFFVCHFPSRIGGKQSSEIRRVTAAEYMRKAADSMMLVYPGIKIAIMGDMNDDPVDKSLYETMGAKGKEKEVATNGLFNPFYEMFKKGFGSLAYADGWNLFDNIIVNEALLNGEKGTLKLIKTNGNKYYGNIFNRSFLLQQSGQYKNYPLRTFVGNVFQNGYSDHLPVFINIAK